MKKTLHMIFMLNFSILSMVIALASPLVPNETSLEFQQLIGKLPAGTTHLLDIAYVPITQRGSKPDSVQKLDLYVPSGKGPFPLVFWIHGGGWHSGGKRESGIHLALKFLPKGFALASVNYRLSADAPFPAQIQDCNAALSYIRKHADSYRIAPQRVGVFGHSAGAHLAALMACAGNSHRFTIEGEPSSRVQAAVFWAIPADLDRVRGKWPMASMMFNDEKAPLWEFFPNKRYDQAFARMASPASYVHADIPPIAMVHGQRDELVPADQAVAFANALKKAGVRLQLRIDPDRGHDVMNAQSIDASIVFFTTILKSH